MMGAADLIAMADTLRATADDMELHQWPVREDIQALRDSADDCDAAAMRLVSMVAECAA